VGQGLEVRDDDRQRVSSAANRSRVVALAHGVRVHRVFRADRRAAVPGAAVVVVPALLHGSLARGAAQPDARSVSLRVQLPRSGEHRLEQPAAVIRRGDGRDVGDLGDLLDRREDEAAGQVAARQHRVVAAGVSRNRPRTVDHDLLSERRHRHLRDDLDYVRRLHHALHALRAALQHDVDAADSPGARGIGGDVRRVVDDDVPQGCAAAVEAGARRRLDLRDDRLHPGAVNLNPAIQSRYPCGVDCDLGTLGERAVRGAVGARRPFHSVVVRPRARRAVGRQPIRNPGISTVLNVEGLFTEYPNDRGEIVRAAQDVTFTVEEGRLFTLLGPSGCGKTTTLRSIAGLERPRAGEISVNGRVVFSSGTGVFVAPNRRGFGMVFQSYAIWPHMTVFENAAFPLEVGDKKYSRKQVLDNVMRVLTAVQLDELAEREATKLSGGQQQRLALARALVMEPALLLLDE